MPDEPIAYIVYTRDYDRSGHYGSFIPVKPEVFLSEDYAEDRASERRDALSEDSERTIDILPGTWGEGDAEL